MEFKRITEKDINVLKPYLYNQKYRSCDYTLGVIYMWNDLLKYEYAIINDNLVISLNIDGEKKYYYPLGNSPLESIKLLKNPTMASVPSIEVENISGTFECIDEHMRKYDDYCYEISSLATLSGKINSKHRNHYNKFIRSYPNYKFIKYDDSYYEKAEEFLHDYHKRGSSSESSRYELEANKKILRLWKELNQHIYLLMVDDKVIGLTMGEIIDDCLFIHIEKALVEYDGSFAAINKEFAETMQSIYKINYINREDDAGDEGLRISKTNYHPVFMVEKHDIKIIKEK